MLFRWQSWAHRPQLGADGDLLVQSAVDSDVGDDPLDAHVLEPRIGGVYHPEELLEALDLQRCGHGTGDEGDAGAFQDLVDGFDIPGGAGACAHGDHGEVSYYHEYNYAGKV